MEATIDFRVMELLCSRLCHDLISPVTAVNNGMELLSDDSDDMSADIRDLISGSAQIASNRLQFFRIAYGLGGQNAAPIGLDEAGRLARGLTEEGKLSLTWPESGALGDGGASRESMKALLNLVLLGFEALPRGGNVAVAVQAGPPITMAITASGKGARLHDDSVQAMSPAVDIGALSARSVQAYFVNLMIRKLGGTLKIESPSEDSLVLRTQLNG